MVLVLYREVKLSWNAQEHWHLSFADVENETPGLITDQVLYEIAQGAIIWSPKEGGMSDDDMRNALVSVVTTKMLANIHSLEEDINKVMGV
jgi:hypothetical protein